MALTKAQRARLEKLAAYLEGLPKNYRHFAMSTVMAADDMRAVARYARKNGGVPSCGTVACAIGHGPAAGILVPPRMIYGEHDALWVSWGEYGTLFMGADPHWVTDWCFGARWSGTDDHHYSAAARIRYLLENGKPPKDYLYPGLRWREVYAPYRIDAKAPAA